MASPGGSATGSLDHGVRRFSRLLPAHVQPDPDSLMKKPKSGLAITLTHGAGVHWLPSSVMTYSRPSALKPPMPLKKARSELPAVIPDVSEESGGWVGATTVRSERSDPTSGRSPTASKSAA